MHLKPKGGCACAVRMYPIYMNHEVVLVNKVQNKQSSIENPNLDVEIVRDSPKWASGNTRSSKWPPSSGLSGFVAMNVED